MLCKHDGQCLGSQWPVDLAGGSSYRGSEAGLCRGLGSDWEHLPLTESQQASGVRKLEFLVFHGGPKDSPHVSVASRHWGRCGWLGASRIPYGWRI